MNMLVISVAVTVFALSVIFWKLLFAKSLNDMQLEKKRFFFTAKQRVFYQVLQQAAGDRYTVFACVSMAEVLRPQHDLSKDKRAAYVKKLKEIQVPFVLCEMNSLEIVAGVMLDVQVPQSQGIEENHFLAQAFKAADLPLLRFKAQESYEMKRMRQSLYKKLGAPKAEPIQDFLDEAGKDTSELVLELLLKPIGESSEPMPDQEQSCPKCNAPMMLKKAEKGRRAGQYFLMCSMFPACKRAMPVTSCEAA